MTKEGWLAHLPRTLIVCVTAALASQIAPSATLLGLLPAFPHDSASASSDVLAQAVPLPHAGDTLAFLARQLPIAPGIVVVQGNPAPAVAPFYVISTHLWPRPIMLVSCEPGAVRHHALSADERRPIGWRLDLTLGGAQPLRVTTRTEALAPGAWCRPGHS